MAEIYHVTVPGGGYSTQNVVGMCRGQTVKIRGPRNGSLERRESGGPRNVLECRKKRVPGTIEISVSVELAVAAAIDELYHASSAYCGEARLIAGSCTPELHHIAHSLLHSFNEGKLVVRSANQRPEIPSTVRGYCSMCAAGARKGKKPNAMERVFFAPCMAIETKKVCLGAEN